MFNWLTDNSIELFGAITGILYVILEVRQKTWLWPVGIVTSAIYIWVFFNGKLYADMSLQVYYVVISILGWYWWVKGAGSRGLGAKGKEQEGGMGEVKNEWVNGRGGEIDGQGAEGCPSPFEGGQGDVRVHITNVLPVMRIKSKLAVKLSVILVVIFAVIYLALAEITDSPVPGWDAFITSLSIIATWMLARKIYEHWYLWIIVNAVSILLCLLRGLYPTVGLYSVYLLMSFIGLYQWRKSIA